VFLVEGLKVSEAPCASYARMRARRIAVNVHLHIVREVFAAWNAHDVDAFIKRMDTKVTWESDAFPAPFTGHDGARQFLKLYVTAISTSISNRSSPWVTRTW